MATAAATRFVKYGDKKMAIDAGLTLETVKGIMARHFPELADPEVKTETKGEETVYVFAKKAGKKGAGRRKGKHAHQRLALKQLAALKPEPAVPDEVVRAVASEGDSAYRGADIGQLMAQAEQVGLVRRALLALQPRPVAGEVTLL